MSNDPKIAVRSKFFHHATNFIVVCYIKIEETFSRIEFSGFILESCQTFVDLNATFANFLMFVDVLIGMEALNCSLQVINGLFEFFLIQFHLVQEFAFLFLQIFVSFFYQLH